MPDILYRSMELRQDAVSDGLLDFSASSETPVDRWGDSEILLHGDGNVRLDRLRALGAMLVNHDPNQRAGAVKEAQVDGKQLRVKAAFLSTAFGQQIQTEVAEGSLRGISVGYVVHKWEYDEKTRTATAVDWEVYEVSLTPIPADASVGVGRSAIPEDRWHRAVGRANPPAAPAAAQTRKETAMPDPIDQKPQDDAAMPTHDEAAKAREIADLRQRAERAEIVAYALRESQAHGVQFSPDEVAGLRDMGAAKDALIAKLAERHARPTAPVGGRLVVTADEVDKHRSACVDGLANTIMRKQVSGNPYAGRSLCDMGRRFAAAAGIDTGDWTRKDAANFVLGRWNDIETLRRGAPNISSADFSSFVMLDAITKIVAMGSQAGAASVIYPRISEINRVPDFKTTKIGALGTANLQETAEGVAFPELSKSEGVFNATAKMWGGTLSLSLQALVNDDTGEFERSLRMAGAIAEKTKEKRAIQKFLRGTATTDTSTWTNNTTSGATLVYTTADTAAAARANMFKAAAALMNKVGQDGNPLGNVPRFLLCGPTAGIYANGLLSNANGNPVANSGALELLISPYFELSTLSGYSTTSYYLLADPMLVTGLIQTVISGFEGIQVNEYDAGATAARNWKIWQPFEFDLFSVANSAGTTVIPAAQQATT